jgi:hypothetical protein
MKIKDVMTPAMCKSTLGGWIWYCDACDTHGNANSSDEAEHMAEAHALYFSWDDSQEYDFDKDPDGENITNFMDIAPEHRADTVGAWSMECLQATYLISVDDNITYQYGEDYSDKSITPIDLDVAIDLQKKMGLA